MWLHGINGKSIPGSASWVPARPRCCPGASQLPAPPAMARTAPQKWERRDFGIHPSVKGYRQRSASAEGSEFCGGSDGAESLRDGEDEAELQPQLIGEGAATTSGVRDWSHP